MAIKECLECGKRISSRAESCPHCGYSGSSDDQDVMRRERARRRKKMGALQLQLGLAMTLLIISAGVMIMQSNSVRGWAMPSAWAMGGALVAVIWYGVTRVRIYLERNR